MANDQQYIAENYPISVFRYKAKIGDDLIYFSEISGLSIQYENTEYREAGENGVRTLQVAGQRNAAELTLKRGLFKDGLDLYMWFHNMHSDDFTKKDVVISLLDHNDTAIMTWTVYNCMPIKFEGPGLDATSSDVSFQTVELVGDSISVANA